MASCEKCWEDSGGDADMYHQLLEARENNGIPCSPEDQAGRDAAWCPHCKRHTVHQHSKECMCCYRTLGPSAPSADEQGGNDVR